MIAFTLGALLVTLVAGFRLAVRYARRRSLGQALGYGVDGLLAFGLYFVASSSLAEAGDTVDFFLRRPRLEFLLHNGSSIEKGAWLDSTTFLCLTGGQAGSTCWGYAHSTTGEKPQWVGNYTYWHHMDGRWYRWVRNDW
ncbi:hypothetical protein [Hymenobacter armeniacus]|uniref:hypothetical protein n=1 Tax=Hymenobacter armeniacus TaxID=2771358 RepID=UPI00168552A9|nr:hypothetical protein [Hymenobacter armeniacus]